MVDLEAAEKALGDREPGGEPRKAFEAEGERDEDHVDANGPAGPVIGFGEVEGVFGLRGI